MINCDVISSEHHIIPNNNVCDSAILYYDKINYKIIINDK